ncbi:uncharacterized protein FA14DRAFT_189350 [Meira miltonrushii]|uniref:Uncharacterized protein n=1 Tax=Meira miltonrushii TaxID=1280837 RepID=A0A316VCL8_9BASI|nr:uncharacterized protein FA14DRAFT_189350 [Meira miltonrushii]PWN35379.1 hypothetical protein FA14DRAFT_189350 [Meira miltonrushii]
MRIRSTLNIFTMLLVVTILLSWTSTAIARPVTFDKAMGIVDQVADVIIPPMRLRKRANGIGSLPKSAQVLLQAVGKMGQLASKAKKTMTRLSSKGGRH